MAFDGRLLNGIGVLAAVVDAGTFVRAGESLGITASGVSRAVARLEERIGVRLFHRSARAVTLTDEGRRFHALVAPLLGAIEDAASEAAGSSSTPKGRLRVSVDALVSRTVLGPHVAELLAENPELSLELVVRDDLGDMIGSGFDVSVRFGEPEPSALTVRKLLETRVLTYASKAYLDRVGRPAHPRELSRHECIHFHDPRTGKPYEWIFQRGGKTTEVKVTGRLTVNDGATRLAACLAGLGIAQMLEIEMQSGREAAELHRGNLVQLFPAWAEERFPLYAYYPSRNLPPAKVRAFIAFVVRLAKEHAGAKISASPYPEADATSRIASAISRGTSSWRK